MSNFHDIINKQNEVIAKKHRSELVIGDDLIRFIHIYIFNNAGELLVTQRSEKKSFKPNVIDPSVGGHVDAGEDFETAAYREMKEELGITTPLEYVCDSWGYYGLCKVFKGVWNDKSTLAINKGEIKKAAFLPLSDVAFLVERTPFVVNDGFVDSFSRYMEATGHSI